MPVSARKVSFFSPIVLTLIVLAAWRFAALVPLPGIDAASLSERHVTLNSNLSIVALGIWPWFQALMLLEAARIMLPRTMVARLALDRHAAPFSRPVIVVALLLAVFQAAGVTAALMSASDLVPQTDKAIQIAMTASLTGGVALMMALARLIDERGMGGGFWIFMAAGPLLTLPSNAAGLFANFEQGLIGPERLVFTILSMVGIFAVVVFVLRARWRAKLPRLEPVIWPLFLAGLAMSLALDAVILLMLPFSSINSLDLPIAILASEPVSSIIFVVAGCLFAARYARLEKSGILWLPSMLLVLLAVLPSAFRSLSGGEILLAGTDAIVMAAVAYSIIQTTQLSPH